MKLQEKLWKREQEFKAAAILADGKISIHNALNALRMFRSHERSLQRLAEIECNGYPREVSEIRDGKLYRYNVEDENLKARCERGEARHKKAVEEMAEAWGLALEFQGDPRGLMFSVKKGNVEINYWDTF